MKPSRNTNFIEFLIKKPTRDLHQLIEKAKKYIRLDDKKQALKVEREERQFVLQGQKRKVF